MYGLVIEENLFVKYSIVNPHSIEGQKIHNFLLGRAKLLAGRSIDFEKNPVSFVMSDIDKPNAFFAPIFKESERPRRGDYENIVYVKNPLDTPVICVTKGLIEMVDNIDQLDYVLGHELTHRIIRDYGVANNSKGEEELADLHSVDLMYDAGSDPKQALKMQEKFTEYAEQQKEETRRSEGILDKEEEGIKWSEILDAHMMHSNRKAALEASLTRLSHLIDERIPSDFDKTVFAVEYSDPITAFLKGNNYEEQEPLDKLRILVDCVEYLSSKKSKEETFQDELDDLQARLDTLSEDDPHDQAFNLKWKLKQLQKSIDEENIGYFAGQTIEKKYQQKLATLAEGIIEQVREERAINQNDKKTELIKAQMLNVYLQNKAYQHIVQNGYPEAGDVNYLDASGIMYTYFYHLFKEKLYRNKYEQKENDARVLPQIEIDIESVKKKICAAKGAVEFIEAAEELKRLFKIKTDIESAYYGYNNGALKFDNLSFIYADNYSFRNSIKPYPDLEANKVIPWNNLVEIAKTDEKTKEYIVSFLKEYDIEDFRITHNAPYIRTNNYDCYAVNDDGSVSDKEVSKYELDYIVNNAMVLAAYDYIRNYFDSESALFDTICDDILSLNDEDFRSFEGVKEEFNRETIADSKVLNFSLLQNSLPEIEDNEGRYRINNKVLELIFKEYMKKKQCLG